MKNKLLLIVALCTSTCTSTFAADELSTTFDNQNYVVSLVQNKPDYVLYCDKFSESAKGYTEKKRPTYEDPLDCFYDDINISVDFVKKSSTMVGRCEELINLNDFSNDVLKNINNVDGSINSDDDILYKIRHLIKNFNRIANVSAEESYMGYRNYRNILKQRKKETDQMVADPLKDQVQKLKREITDTYRCLHESIEENIGYAKEQLQYIEPLKTALSPNPNYDLTQYTMCYIVRGHNLIFNGLCHLKSFEACVNYFFKTNKEPI